LQNERINNHKQSQHRGPNWIHGTDDNPILKLAEATNSKLASLSGKINAYGSNGMLIDSQKVSTGLSIVWDIITDGFKYSNENCKDIPSNLSLKDFFRKKVEASCLDKETKEFILELAEM
jgi:hypothetical protein